MPHCVITDLLTPHTLVTSRSLTTAALTLASLPLAVGVYFWNGALRRRDLWADLDPFEIDLQLTDRNDA